MTTEGKRCPDLGHAKDDSSFRLQFLKGLDKALLELEAVGDDQPGLRNSGQLCRGRLIVVGVNPERHQHLYFCSAGTLPDLIRNAAHDGGGRRESPHLRGRGLRRFWLSIWRACFCCAGAQHQCSEGERGHSQEFHTADTKQY